MRALLTLGLSALVLACAAPASGAVELRPDPDAPPGAPADWLPQEEWVMERWMPFDEDDLFALIRLGRAETYDYLKWGDESLRQLAVLRGVPAAGLAGRLLRSRRGTVSPAGWRILRRRTARMLSQRHLAEHVIGHAYHHWAIWRSPERIFGPRFRELSATGLTDGAVAARQGITAGQVHRRMLSALDATTLRGVRNGSMSARQGERQRHWHRHLLAYYIPLDLGAPAAAARPKQPPELICALEGDGSSR